jgi:hypothetical protein
MSNRYNFHDLKAAFQKDPANFKLPVDVNEPVKEALNKIGCDVGVEFLSGIEKRCGYGGVVLVHDDAPHKRIQIDVACGMAEGRTDFEEVKKGKWTAFSYRTIKNKNLDKTNKKKEAKV